MVELHSRLIHSGDGGDEHLPGDGAGVLGILRAVELHEKPVDARHSIPFERVEVRAHRVERGTLSGGGERIGDLPDAHYVVLYLVMDAELGVGGIRPVRGLAGRLAPREITPECEPVGEAIHAHNAGEAGVEVEYQAEVVGARDGLPVAISRELRAQRLT